MDDAVEPILRDNLLLLAREFKRVRKIKMTTVSRLIHGDHPFFRDLARKRCGFTARKYDQMLEAFKAQWPAGKTMPTVKTFPPES